MTAPSPPTWVSASGGGASAARCALERDLPPDPRPLPPPTVVEVPESKEPSDEEMAGTYTVRLRWLGESASSFVISRAHTMGAPPALRGHCMGCGRGYTATRGRRWAAAAADAARRGACAGAHVSARARAHERVGAPAPTQAALTAPRAPPAVGRRQLAAAAQDQGALGEV